MALAMPVRAITRMIVHTPPPRRKAAAMIKSGRPGSTRKTLVRTFRNSPNLPPK